VFHGSDLVVQRRCKRDRSAFFHKGKISRNLADSVYQGGTRPPVELKLLPGATQNWMTTATATQRKDEGTIQAGFLEPALAAKVLVLVGLILALYWGVLKDMARDWWTVDAYSQGMLLPPLAVYVAWLSKESILAHAPKIDYRGLLLTGFACLLYTLGQVASEFFMTRFSFVLLLAGLVWTFWGLQRLKMLTFPFLLLATMVPLPALVYNSLAVPLQLLASDYAAHIAQVLGVSVFRDGNVLQLASTTLGVAEACSGLNSLSALIVGSLLFGYLLCTSLASRVVLFLLAAPLAVAVNIARVAGTAVIADYNQEFAMGFYHSFSGWLVFVLGSGLLYVSARLLHATLERK
jgi:exosortase